MAHALRRANEVRLSAKEPQVSLKTLCVIGCIYASMLGCQSVPSELAVKGPQVAKVHATGVQIYTWDSEWKLKAPEATFTGDITGKHYAGPTWESTDGSKVKGHKLREHPVDGAIPWLLLDCTAREGT